MADTEKVMNGLKCCAEDVNKFGDCLSNDCPYKHKQACCSALARDALELLKAQQPIKPHRNYQYLSDYWCACGWHLGRAGSVKYCPECGRKVDWNV